MRTFFFVVMLIVECSAFIVNVITAPAYARIGNSSKPITSIILSALMIIGTFVLYGG